EAPRCLYRMPAMRSDILAGHALRALESRPAVGRSAGRDRVPLSYPTCPPSAVSGRDASHPSHPRAPETAGARALAPLERTPPLDLAGRLPLTCEARQRLTCRAR